MSLASIFNFLLCVLLFTASISAEDKPRGLPNISKSSPGDWDISADFLAWFASEEASNVWADIIKIGNNKSSFTPENFNFDWDFGFRLGAGHSLTYDGWDTQLCWTYFRTEAHQSQKTSLHGIETIHPEFFAGDLSDDNAREAKIGWSILFNMFDWELGRSFWLSNRFSLRPFVSLKGGWIHQSIDVGYDNLIINNLSTTESGREHATNNFWGIGPACGLSTQWKLRNFGTHYPSLFGDFSVATLWGTWTCTDTYKNTTDAKVIVHMNKLTLGALMLQGFLGAGWDVDFNNNQSHFALKLGYEMQLWVNQLRLPTSQLIQLHGDLTLQGVTLHCRFDF